MSSSFLLYFECTHRRRAASFFVGKKFSKMYFKVDRSVKTTPSVTRVVILQACVDHNYLLYRSVDYGKHAWRLFGTIFKQIRAQRRAAPGSFGFTGAKGCCGGSSHGFWEKFNSAVVRDSETQTERKERWIVVASPLRSINNDQVEARREAGISEIALPLPRNHEVMRTIIYLKKNRKLSSSCSLSWKIALIKENPARVLLTCLLQGEQTLLDWSSVCKTVKLRSLKPSANFRFVTPWQTWLSKKKSRWSVSFYTSNLYLPFHWSNLIGTANPEVIMIRRWDRGGT